MTDLTGTALVELDLMTTAEVAAAFDVNPKTVTRWAKAGKVPCVQMPCGHRLYARAVVEQILRGEGPSRTTESGVDSGDQPRWSA